MSDTLIAYYAHHVVTPYFEYRTVSEDKVFGNQRDLRKAIEAISALFHFREHLPPNLVLTRTATEALCQDYGLLGDAANSAKHNVITGRTPHGPPLVDSVKSISEEKVIIRYQDDLGEYSISLKLVFLKLSVGGERYLLEVLTNVINFWEGYLHSNAVLPTKRVFQCNDPFRYRSRVECKNSSDGIELTQGLPAQLRFRFMQFDKAKGHAVPVDLTGAKLEFRVFEDKPVDLVITAKRNVDGKVFEKTVQISRKQAHEMETYTDDAARSQFLASIPSVRNGLVELSAELKAHEKPEPKESNDHQP